MTALNRCLVSAGLVLCLCAPGCQSGTGSVRSERHPRRGRAPVSAEKPSSLALGGEEAALAEGAGGGAAPQDADAPEEPAAEEESPAPARPAPARPAGRPAPARAKQSPRTADQALEDLKETGQLQVAEADYHRQLGDDAYNALDYVTAVEEYRKALDLNPTLNDVRERWARASLVLGRRGGEVTAVQREFGEGDRVRKQQRLVDARQGLKEGLDLKEKGDLDNAERKFRKVYEELLWFEFPVDVTDLRQQAQAQIREVEKLKRDRQSAAQDDKSRIATEAAEQALKTEQKVRDQRVHELVRKAADYIRLKEYDKAIDACERILQLKPDHRVAKFWLRDVKRQQVDQKKLQIYRDHLENSQLMEESLTSSAVPYTDIFVFPGEDEWAKARRRKDTLEVVSLEDPEWVRKIRNNLDQKLSFAFEQQPLAQALAFLADATGVTIIADTAINTQELMVDLTAKEMKAIDALSQVLLQTGLAYTFKDNILFITEKDKAKPDTHFSIYNVSDILNKIRSFEGPEIKLKSQDDQSGKGTGTGNVSFSTGGAEEQGPIDATNLIELIKEGSGGDEKWGEQNTIEFHKGQLMVNASKELHGAIQATLQNLREDSDLFVVMEARFIDIREDFLEDIGIDSRSLGEGSNFGTPFGNVLNLPAGSSSSKNDLGFVQQGNPVKDVKLIMGQDRWGGRMQNIIDGFTGLVSGDNLKGGPGRIGGLTAQATWLEPFQINVILRAVQEKADVRQLTAPIVTAHNGQRVYVSVITQRAYIADYELVSGGTGFTIIEVADPVVQTFQEGVILDVDPVISPDKKYITLDVRPTMATLIGGVISTIRISLGSFTNVAFQVPIGVPEITLQQSFTSVTVPNGGTVLLGGFKSLSEQKFVSYIPLLGKIPLVKNLFRRKAEVDQKQSLVILITARIVDLRLDERSRYNE